MSNYHEMDHDELQSEYKKLNKLLIIPNILVVIISVVAFAMQMFTPFFKVSVTLNSNVVASAVDALYSDYGEDDPLIESDNTVMTTLLTKSNIKEMTSSLNTTLSLELTETELFSLAFASEDVIEDEVVTLLAGMVDKMNIKDEIEAALNDMMPSVISTVVTSVVTDAVISSLSEDTELTEEQTEVINNASAAVSESVSKLAETTTAEEFETVKEEVKTEVTETVSSAMTDLGFSDEDISSVQETIETYYDEFISAAVDEDGNFSYVTLVENIDTLIENLTSSGELSEEDASDISGIIEDLTGGDGEITEEDISGIIEDLTGGDSGTLDMETILELIDSDTKAVIISTLSASEILAMSEDELNEYIYNYYITYYYNSSSGDNSSSSTNEINPVKYMLTDDVVDSGTSTDGTESTEDTTASISYYINLLDDSEALVRELLGDSLDHETLQSIKIVTMGIFFFVAVTSAVWVILALLAILHIFLPNKKLGMWYVKLFGGLTAIIFYAVPALLILFAGSLVPTLASMLSIDASMLSTVFGAISFGGSGLAVLICLLVLWLVSIFVCFPIKRKIRKCKKELKHADEI